MRAAFIRSLGGPGVVEVGELPTPEPGKGEVLIKVKTSSLDPVDGLVRSGVFPTSTPFPFVLGRDLVGTVVDAGEGAEDLLGTDVASSSLGYDGRQGAWAEYTVADCSRIYQAPDDIDRAELTAALHPASTAHLALHEQAKMTEDDTVFVGGAAGNVGSAAVAEASRSGARVIAAARARDEDYVRSLGADEVVDFTQDDLHEELRRVAKNRISVFIDTSGRMDYDVIADLMKVRGRILAMAAPPKEPHIPLARLYTRNISILGFAMSQATADELGRAYATTVQLLRETPWRPNITDTVSIESARSLHQSLDDRSVRGRIIVTPR